jgi:SSS family solute:Na+ symporter
MITTLILVALLACLVGGLLAGRKIRLLEYTANRSRSDFSHLLFTILASLIGGWMFFGLCAVGYQAGVVGIVIGLGYCIGLFLLGLAIPTIKQAMEREKCDTLDDFVGVRFGQTAQLCVTTINLLFFLAVLAAQFIALSAFLSIFAELDPTWSFYATVVIVIAYTAYAGFKGVILTDIWQFYVLAFSAVVIFIILAFNADWTAVAALPSMYFNGSAYGLSFIIGVLFLFPPSLLARTDLWQRIVCAKDTKSAQRAFLISAPVMLAFYVIFTSVGIFGRAALGDNVEPQTSGFIHLLNIVRFMGGSGSIMANLILSVIALGVLAALLSTADTNLNVVAVAVAKLIRRNEWIEFEAKTVDKEIGPRTDLETRLLNTARFVSVVLGVASVGVAKAVPNIVDLIVGAGSAIMVFLPTVLMGLFRNNRRSSAAVTSILSGFLVLLLFLIKSPKIAFLPATLVSVVGYYIVSVSSGRKATSNEKTSEKR